MKHLKLSATWSIVALFVSASTPAYCEITASRNLAEDQVKWQRCDGSENVDAYLSKQSRHSQPDLGWRVFETKDGGFDVERAYMISKGMEIRYRWHVDSRGAIRPANRRAEELCS